MNHLSSSIRRIGLINSGMFHSLELNLDVTALHLVGQNNVGKTSLIALIQFLYFHDTRDMTFTKSLPETMTFYFRPEGSYILFEVRTISGGTRTIGIYGEGTPSSRQIFVFDASFDSKMFLNEKKITRPLKDVQPLFFDRNFRIYRKFEMYEKALLGLEPDSTYNVQLFDLEKENFRLLRKLLQGLLRLDRLTSKDIQGFLINIVETGEAVKTKINVAQEFDTKYRDI